MKANIKKHSLFVGTLLTLLISFSLLFMYFSHDLSTFKEGFPHRLKNPEQGTFTIKKSKPVGWVRLTDISKYLKWGIIISEDWSFYNHKGVDLNQIKVALEDMIDGERFRGASTITQQMIKNVLLSNKRTLWRKTHEIILALKIEEVLSKQQILEIYLNVIEFGPSVYGIREASFHYFQKHPSELTPREAAFLAFLLPSPRGYYRSFKNKKLTPFAEERIKKILEKMRMAKIINPEEYEYELNQKFIWEELNQMP